MVRDADGARRRRSGGALRALQGRRRSRRRGAARRRWRRPRPTPRSRSTGPRSSIAAPSSWRRRAPAAAEWKQGLAEALANAGRPPEAARRLSRAPRQAPTAGGRSSFSVAPPNSSSIGGHIDRGPGRDPHGPRAPSAHAAGAEPADGARLAVLAARPDPLARTRVRGARPRITSRRTVCCALIPAGP